MLALEGLGLSQRLLERGTPIVRLRTLTWRGHVLRDDPYGEWSRPFGAPSIVVDRAELLAALAEALGEDRTRVGRRCVGFAQDSSGVTARFADGREERGDLLVGADCVDSIVRRQVVGPESARYAGYAAWRGVLSRSL